MVIIFVYAQPKEGMADAFEATLEPIVKAARQQPGCLTYEWFYTLDSAPKRYVIFGEFNTRAVFDAYLQSEVVKRIGQELIPLLDNKPTFKHYEASVFKEG